MAIEIGCSCSTGNGNTGLPECASLFGVAKGLGVTQMVANDGTVQRVDLSVTSITTAFSALLTDSERSKRLFPITEIRSITFPKEDNQYETDTSGQKSELRQGIQSFLGEKWDIEPAFDAKLQQMKCPRNGSYIFSAKGVQGVRKYDTTDSKYYLYPIEMRAFAPYYMPQTDGNKAKEMIPFDFAPTVQAGELWMVSWSDLGTTYDDMIGLLDVNFNVVDVPVAGATTSVSYRLITDYGDGLYNNTTQNVDDLVTASFTAFNVTTGLAVVITSVTEVIDDKYSFVLPSQTATDVMRISLVTTTGFEGSVTFVEP
jgi:hypothetical protein